MGYAYINSVFPNFHDLNAKPSTGETNLKLTPLKSSPTLVSKANLSALEPNPSYLSLPSSNMEPAPKDSIAAPIAVPVAPNAVPALNAKLSYLPTPPASPSNSNASVPPLFVHEYVLEHVSTCQHCQSKLKKPPQDLSLFIIAGFLIFLFLHYA